jgi:hypothetical protein
VKAFGEKPYRGLGDESAATLSMHVFNISVMPAFASATGLFIPFLFNPQIIFLTNFQRLFI